MRVDRRRGKEKREKEKEANDESGETPDCRLAVLLVGSFVSSPSVLHLLEALDSHEFLL